MWQLAILGHTAVRFGAGAGNPGCFQAEAAEVSTWLTDSFIYPPWSVDHCSKCLKLGTTQYPDPGCAAPCTWCECKCLLTASQHALGMLSVQTLE